MALHTDDAPVKYDTIKDDLTGYKSPDDVDDDKANYLDLIENTGILKYEDDLSDNVDAVDVDNANKNYIDLVENIGTSDA